MIADIYKIATLNINGLASQTGIGMLEDFMHKRETSNFYRNSRNPCLKLFVRMQGYQHRNHQAGYGYPYQDTCRSKTSYDYRQGVVRQLNYKECA
jgi:hypothetical protein